MALTPEQKARLDEIKKKKTSTGAASKSSSKTVSPYGDAETEAFLKQFGVTSDELSTAPIGHQSKTTLGGKKDIETWKRNNPNFMTYFKTNYGREFNPEDPADMAIYEPYHHEHIYNGVLGAVKRSKPDLSDEEAKKFADNVANKLSFAGEKGKDVNAPDQAWGNFHRTRREIKFDEPAKTPAQEKKTPATSEITPRPAGPYTSGRQDSPWWLQDVVNTAAAAGTRLGLKKYLPWAPKVELQTPRPTFFDPTRELAANAENMQIGTQGAGLFAGPQTFNARYSGIQGQGAKNAANILGQYHNKNVGVANQFENLRADIYNRNNMANANTAQKLYDQTTVANQQFDNAKRQANNELRASYVNAITNRAMTQTLNTMYPHFQVDPSTGGMLGFYKGSPMKAEEQTSALDRIDSLMARGWDRKDALDFLGYGTGSSRNPGANTYINQDVAFSPYMQQMQAVGNPAIGPGMGPGYGYQPE